MARNLEFYKGSRKRRNYALIPFVVLLALLVLAVVLFYTVQKYAVISKDGVEVVLPGMETNEGTHIDSQGHEVKTFERVETSLVFDVPDYSHVEEREAEENTARERERKRQTAILAIQKKYGKNAILKGMNFEDGAMTRERNGQVGGHRAGSEDSL